MKKQKGLGNKGFSLVELIIVIAIMAILVGVMAPQLLKYVERTRESADKQVADTVRTAIVTTLLDPDITDGPTATSTNKTLAETMALGGPNFQAAHLTTLSGKTAVTINASLTSKAYKQVADTGDKFLITVNPIAGTVEVTLNANSGSGATDFVVK